MADHRDPNDPPFRSQRPDGKGPNEPYQPPPHLAGKSDEELRQKLSAVERDFYWSRHEDRGKTRGEFEREWNDLKAELNRRKHEANLGKRVKPWVYKHDRRDACRIRQKTTRTKQDFLRTRTTVLTRVDDTRTTINWRNTGIGAERHEAIRQSFLDRGLLVPGQHDLGHIAAAEHGSDPEGVNRGLVTSKTAIEAVPRPNYTSQPATSNERRGWKTEEYLVSRASRTAPVANKTTSIATEKRGLHRELYRKSKATQILDGRRVTVSRDVLLHAGTNDHAIARERAERAAKRKAPVQPSADQGVEVKRAKSQRLTDDRKAKTTPAATKGVETTIDHKRGKIASQTQSKPAPQQSPKKSV